MSHLLFAEKHQQILLEKCGKQTDQGGARYNCNNPKPEVYAAEASRRPPRGYTKRPHGKPKRYVPRGMPHKPKPHHSSSKPEKSNCHKCCRKGHYAKEYRASAYVIELYKEVQKLKGSNRENYNFHVQPNQDLDIENYMTIRSEEFGPNIALLDSASTHTILTNSRFFEFPAGQSSWQSCKITTMAGSWDLKFREGRAKIMLPGGSTFICQGAMFAPDVR